MNKRFYLFLPVDSFLIFCVLYFSITASTAAEYFVLTASVEQSGVAIEIIAFVASVTLYLRTILLRILAQNHHTHLISYI